ncbi:MULTISPECIES: response regulator [Proteiniphilum]|jgi:DNA-binding NarL/FixJ family response regulator|uniref:response regulator n=1 Tax=Proteiniphilum TaxID=294702 RepID=UPI001EE9C518|nr:MULTISPECIES: response regulator transcription factor [Proteiniphilum]MDD2246649.1 response regulator transcription factor [Proteiniphilum sp.]MDD3909146.1 response regulator transcription factor [Proteiniphilum sp.]MDD4416099.1 response regulator transcription factor [Proteiniphilum sp.]ULB34699.1 response regulator transcription factor [Proteiniphilum propionicum]
MIQVLIVDDHKILVEGLKKLIDESEFATVCSTAYTGKECLQQLTLKKADVVLLDINLPDISGIDLCKEIHQRYPDLKIVALTSYGEYAMVRRTLENGAMGYVIKNAMPEEILLGIRTVMDGERFLSEEIDMLMRKRSRNPVWLTPREKELLQFIVEGYTNPEIADKMCLGNQTINSYRKNLLLKLGAKNTAVLVRMALEEKLV